MILEYNNFTNQIKNDVVIEVLSGPYWDFILNEEFNYEFYNKNKEIKVPEEYRLELKDIEITVDDYLNKINPFQGLYFNGRSKQTRLIDFKIITTEHWFTKFFRKEFEDDRYINPELHEGIDIIHDNINELTRMIDVGLILNNYRVLIKSKDSYSEIVIFERINPKTYNIVLQTQMKGKEYHVNKDVNRIAKLPPKTKNPN